MDGGRRLVVVVGGRRECVEWARRAIARVPAEDVVWIASDASRRDGQRSLGREAQVAVVDLHPGVEPDVIGAVHGVVRRGGGLLWLCPPLDAWADARGDVEQRMAIWPYVASDVGTRFVRRLARMIGAEGIDVLAADDAAIGIEPAAPRTKGPLGPRTEDQARAVEALGALGDDPPRRVVLTAHRGRGKSWALGLAVPGLLARTGRVIVTAPTREAAGEVLRLAGDRALFLPPGDAALRTGPRDALLVDEAAALPLPLLERLARATERVAFATTVHGYEGTGRGFVLRFLETLRQRDPALLEIHLEEPVRFARGDRVEAFVHRALALDAEPAPIDPGPRASVQHQVLDRDALAEDEPLLRELFGLLVHAHYRTAPGDLRRLLDAPNLAVHVLREGARVAAAALVAAEGGLEAAACRDLATGAARIRGHAVPENLVCHLGEEEAGALPVRRVVRVAVHPDLRRRGLGTALLGRVAVDARAAGASLVGSVFGASPELLRFWHTAGYRTVRLSASRSARSGEHSALVLLPLDGRGEALVARLRRRLARDLPHALGDGLREVEPDVALEALSGSGPGGPPALDPADLRAIRAYAFGPRPYDAAARPVFELVAAALAGPLPPVAPDVARLLVLKVLERRPFAEVAAEAGLGSVPATMRAVRAAVARVCAAAGIEGPS